MSSLASSSRCSILDHVIAVEPQNALWRWLVRICPDAEVFAETAEQIPLAAASVGAVFIGEAFHLFGSERTLAEIARVLRSRARLS